MDAAGAGLGRAKTQVASRGLDGSDLAEIPV